MWHIYTHTHLPPFALSLTEYSATLSCAKPTRYHLDGRSHRTCGGGKKEEKKKPLQEIATPMKPDRNSLLANHSVRPLGPGVPRHGPRVARPYLKPVGPFAVLPRTDDPPLSLDPQRNDLVPEPFELRLVDVQGKIRVLEVWPGAQSRPRRTRARTCRARAPAAPSAATPAAACAARTGT